MRASGEFKARVTAAVRAKLGDAPWFRGVCLDGIDEYADDFDEAVANACGTTMYWDAPNYGFDEEAA